MFVFDNFVSTDNMAGSVYDFTVKDIDDKVVNLADFKGKVMLFVNTARKWGKNAVNMKELQILQDRYHDKGLEIFLFPSNTFSQEPCCVPDTKENYKNYNSTSHLMALISVNGANTSPLWTYMKNTLSSWPWTRVIKWNFTKFIADRNGKPVLRFEPTSDPLSFEKDIQKLLGEV